MKSASAGNTLPRAGRPVNQLGCEDTMYVLQPVHDERIFDSLLDIII